MTRAKIEMVTAFYSDLPTKQTTFQQKNKIDHRRYRRYNEIIRSIIIIVDPTGTYHTIPCAPEPIGFKFWYLL